MTGSERADIYHMDHPEKMNNTRHKGLPALSDDQFSRISSILYKNAGIVLKDDKRTLMVSRLKKILRGRGFASFDEYCDHLVTDKTGAALSELVDSMSTSFTFFNREKEHFDFFYNKALPDIKNSVSDTSAMDFRIWCAAAATGEEPYMLAMLSLKYSENADTQWGIKLLATDISSVALQKAKQGVYCEECVSKLPQHLKEKYFVKDGNDWRVTDRLKEYVHYKRLNLVNMPFPFKKKFHVIFCRNVMIYFDRETRLRLVREMHRVTEPGGYLFVGHSEAVNQPENPYEYIMPAVYRKHTD